MEEATVTKSDLIEMILKRPVTKYLRQQLPSYVNEYGWNKEAIENLPYNGLAFLYQELYNL